jgi:hypothetical protein
MLVVVAPEHCTLELGLQMLVVVAPEHCNPELVQRKLPVAAELEHCSPAPELRRLPEAESVQHNTVEPLAGLVLGIEQTAVQIVELEPRIEWVAVEPPAGLVLRIELVGLAQEQEQIAEADRIVGMEQSRKLFLPEMEAAAALLAAEAV